MPPSYRDDPFAGSKSKYDSQKADEQYTRSWHEDRVLISRWDEEDKDFYVSYAKRSKMTKTHQACVAGVVCVAIFVSMLHRSLR